MKHGEYQIPTNLPWSKDYEQLNAFIEEFEKRLNGVSDSLAEQRKLMQEFLTRYLELRNEIEGLNLPVKSIVSTFDHKAAYRLWLEVAGFTGA